MTSSNHRITGYNQSMRLWFTFAKPRRLFTMALGLAGLSVLGLTAGLTLKRPEKVMRDRPRSVATQSGFTQTGNVISVAANGNLQRALDQAQCGDTIVIDAGTALLAPADQGFVFPAKSGGPCTGTADDTITVRTANLRSLPPAGQRVGISDAANLAKLVTAGPYPAN